MNVMTIPIIVVLCYCFAEIYKSFIKNEENKRIIPALVCLVGGIMGLLMFFFDKSLIDAKEPFTAVIIGIASGASSTGCNQILKQLCDVDKKDQ